MQALDRRASGMDSIAHVAQPCQPPAVISGMPTSWYCRIHWTPAKYVRHLKRTGPQQRNDCLVAHCQGSLPINTALTQGMLDMRELSHEGHGIQSSEVAYTQWYPRSMCSAWQTDAQWPRAQRR